MVYSGIIELGNRPFRILDNGTGKQDRIHGIHIATIKDYTRSNNTKYIHTIFGILYESAV